MSVHYLINTQNQTMARKEFDATTAVALPPHVSYVREPTLETIVDAARAYPNATYLELVQLIADQNGYTFVDELTQ